MFSVSRFRGLSMVSTLVFTFFVAAACVFLVLVIGPTIDAGAGVDLSGAGAVCSVADLGVSTYPGVVGVDGYTVSCSGVSGPAATLQFVVGGVQEVLFLNSTASDTTDTAQPWTSLPSSFTVTDPVDLAGSDLGNDGSDLSADGVDAYGAQTGVEYGADNGVYETDADYNSEPCGSDGSCGTVTTLDGTYGSLDFVDDLAGGGSYSPASSLTGFVGDFASAVGPAVLITAGALCGLLGLFFGVRMLYRWSVNRRVAGLP